MGAPVGGAPRPPVGAVTPCFFRQLSNAAVDDEVDDVVGVVVDDVVGVVVVAVDDEAAAAPQAASTTPERATARSTTGKERYRERGLLESVVFFTSTVWRANLDARLGRSNCSLDAHGPLRMGRRDMVPRRSCRGADPSRQNKPYEIRRLIFRSFL